MFEPLTDKCTVASILTESEYYAPKVFIEFDALIKMKSYIENTDKEIAWLGLCRKVDESYVIYDVDLLKQETSGVTAEIHESGLQEYADMLIKSNRYDELENVRVWGHSHVNMEVMPSSTDEETFEEYYKECNYFIRIIANKKGKLKLDIALKNEKIVYTNVQWIIKYPEDMIANQKNIELLQQEYEKLKKEIEDFQEKRLKEIEDETKAKIKEVTKEKYSTVTPYYGGSYYSKMYSDNPYNWHRYYDDDCPSRDWKEKEEKKEEEIPWSAEDLEILISEPSTGIMYEVCVDEVLSPEEIAVIAETKEIPKEIKNRLEFEEYMQSDWRDLIYACEAYWGEIGGLE